jgi:Flp pilus assembly pilin Flp
MVTIRRIGLLLELEDSAARVFRNEECEMASFLRRYLNDEQGQDLIEYTLLLAFVCLASAALFISAGGSVSGIWSATNSQLAVANTSAS